MRRIRLTNSPLCAVVDSRDYDLVNSRKWLLRSGHAYSTTSPYIGMHNLILHTRSLVDHEDGNGLNNRRRNLRKANHSQNRANHSPGRYQNKLGYKGVFVNKNRFGARIVHRGRGYSLGSFPSVVKAAKAYDSAARKLHGEFAVTNF